MGKIWVLTDHFAAGGIGVVVEKEAMALSELGLDVTIVCNSEGAISVDDWERVDPGGFARIAQAGIGIESISERQLPEAIERINVNDVVLIHTSWRGRGFSLSLADWAAKAAFFFVHNSSTVEPPTMDSVLLMNLKKSRGVLYGSSFVENDLYEVGLSVPQKRIPYGVDERVFSTIGAEPFSMRKRVAIYIGRLIEEKGAHLLNAVAELLERKAIEILIHGAFRDHDLSAISSLIRTTSGALKPNEVADLYRSSTAIVVPSLRGEGQPLCVLEAMACGTAVVATPFALGGLDDTSFAFVTKPEANRIANAIEDVFCDANRAASRILHGRKIVGSMSWQAHATAVVDQLVAWGYPV